MSKMIVLPMGKRASLALAFAAVFAAMAFGWPFFVGGTSVLAKSMNTPLFLAAVLVLVLMVVISELVNDGLDAKVVAMLGVLTAAGAALRPLGTGIAGLEPMFFLLILGGRAFGPGFGFLLGTTTLFASALITGGVGPWLPYQMLAAAWVAAGAGLLPQANGRTEVALLAAYGAVVGVAYGLAMNLSFWPFLLGSETAISFVPGAPIVDNFRRFVAFSAVTSLGFDIPRGVLTASLVTTTARPVLRALRRSNRRASFHAPAAAQSPS